MPKHLREVLAIIHDEVVSKYYGCGLVVPTCLENMKIVDLGSGSGRDCYALSKLVGKDGYVVGVDMTDEQVYYTGMLIVLLERLKKSMGLNTGIHLSM